ncbi:hypothetical protein [Streptomyces rubellomurinus]|uniref:SWIM-type domain-containing protein n=1 Tax=Streptomyces rubellomurinus (strain ATCC 31215) TaxID=359131 RepID=A0A0F2T8D4_STRR3|nr:hypothetical protein [Streptomyces rubellomurinus]KJS57992.1 hypothetical protein VM95_36180 [Streptomyces rubellomurinus]
MNETTSDGDWPGVRPEVVAEVVSALSARLQKRLDGAAAKLAQRPVTRSGHQWRVEVDEETLLVLHAPDGVVADPADVRCGCLLAPACAHRAAAVTLCPLAEPGPDTTEPPAPDTARTQDAPAEDTLAEDNPTLAPSELAAARHLHHAACAVLAAGVGAAGAVTQAELLHAAHGARLAGLHRPAAAAVTVATRLRAARSGAPDHRLADLVSGLRDLLALTTALTRPPAGAETSAPLAELRGTARRTYAPEGGLRLHGLFTEPVLTATHAGAVSWAVDADGRLSTIAEVMPHTDAATAPAQAAGAGNRALRLGDAPLSHREFSRAGLTVQGATRSATGRLGAGAAVRAVRAAGSAWTAGPAARLWSEPVADQVARALAAEELPYESRPAGSDLLFLDVTLLGPAPSGPDGAPQLLARCAGRPGPAGPVIALLPGHEHPELAFRANLALLATAPGLRLRVIGRLERSDRPELRLLALGAPPQPADPQPAGPVPALPADRAGRVNLGLERLQTADLPADLPAGPPAEPPVSAADTTPTNTRLTNTTLTVTTPTPPVHLLARRVAQTVTTGRQAPVPNAATAAADRRLLRAAGLATAAELLDGLRAEAASRGRDVFGRVVPDDHGAFAAAWLAAACYTEALAAALCTAAWAGEG